MFKQGIYYILPQVSRTERAPYSASVTTLTEHRRPKYQLSEVLQPQTDADWTALVIGTGFRRIDFFNKIIYSAFLPNSQSRSKQFHHSGYC
jgi:hypothetical protein